MQRSPSPAHNNIIFIDVSVAGEGTVQCSTEDVGNDMANALPAKASFHDMSDEKLQ